LAELLLARGIAISNASDHFYGRPHLHGFRVGFAFFEPEVLRRALTTLSTTLREHFPAAVPDDVSAQQR
jgi:DNA-binding transcriptional MocR family regulator